MVAVPSPQPFLRRRSLELIQGSFSARRVVRQAPWLAGLHRASDGLLVALGLSMVGLTALTLHWQGAWTRSFERLESTQVLEHRLQESTAVLEQHHLAMARRPGLLVPTSLQQLIHLPSPSSQAPDSQIKPSADQPQLRPFNLQSMNPRALSVELSRITLDPRVVRAGY